MSFAIESLIDAALKRTGLTADNLSAMSRIRGCLVSTSKISGALNGVRPLYNEEALFLKEILDDLEALMLASYPLPLSTKNPTVLCRLIQDMKDAPLDIPTLQDFILLSSVLSGQKPEDIANGRQITTAQLKERVSEIVVKGERAFARVMETMNG